LQCRRAGSCPRTDEKLQYEPKEKKSKQTKKRMATKTEANNKKFAVLQGTLVSRMDIQQTRTEANQREKQPRRMPGQKELRPV
jgi:hypothetical protein